METSKGASAGRRASSTLEVNPRELYRICKEQADGIEATPYGKRVRDLAAHLLFSRPLFETAYLAGDMEFQEFTRKNYPFDHSLAQHIESKVPEVEWRYGQLLQQLKKQEDTELRWLLIARWLKQEGICEPAQFLRNDMLRRLAKRYQKNLSLSPTDLKYWAIIENWLPYFKKIRDALRAAKQRHPER